MGGDYDLAGMFGDGVAAHPGAPLAPKRSHPEYLRTGYRAAGFAVNASLHVDLFQAAEIGHADMISVLLQKERVNVYAKNEQGDTPLHRAAMHGHDDTVAVLLADGRIDPALLSGYNCETALHLAARGGHTVVVQHLLADPRVDPTVQNKVGKTALHHAAQCGHESTCAVLGARVGPSGGDSTGWTALHWAAQCGQTASVEALLRTEDVNALNDAMWTPFHMAADAGHEAVLAVMLADPKVDVNALTGSGRTATWKDSWNFHEGWSGGRHALHLAAEKQHRGAVELLLGNRRVNRNVLDAAGDSFGYLAGLHGATPSIVAE